MRSPRCSRRKRSWRFASAAGATIAARSWVICRRRWSWVRSTRKWGPVSRSISRGAAVPDRKAAWDFLENSDLVAGAPQVQSAIERLAQEITQALAESYPLVLVV